MGVYVGGGDMDLITYILAIRWRSQRINPMRPKYGRKAPTVIQLCTSTFSPVFCNEKCLKIILNRLSGAEFQNITFQ
jgi:hypothetical protein